MDNISFVCPNCGNDTFKVTRKVETYKDFAGATCSSCGTVLTDDDIKTQARKIATDRVRDAFRKSGLKFDR